MIAKLTGEVVDVLESHIIVDVEGVGYLVAVKNPMEFTEGSHISLRTHLAVRENALDLYGFQTSDEYSLFEQLIKLPKIGPKTGLQILSQADVQTIKKAVQTEDPSYLSKVSGIGKKSAEKIVMGLKDVLDTSDITEGGARNSQGDADVIETLITLGYSQKDAIEAVQQIPGEIHDTQDRIKHALKYISG